MIRMLFSLLFFGAIIFVVAGWFLNWYEINPTKSSNGKTQFSVEVDTSKIKTDLNKGKDKLAGTIDNFREKGAAQGSSQGSSQFTQQNR